jgi:hypothetical protein
MRLPGIMHVEADLLNGIGDVRPSEGEVLKGPGKTPVRSGVVHRWSLSLRQLALKVDRGGAGLAIRHPSPLQDIPSVLPLVKKEPSRTVLNSDTEKVMELTEVLHRKLLLESCNDPAEKMLAGGGEDNVINIE